jgi:hypothetical protein
MLAKEILNSNFFLKFPSKSLGFSFNYALNNLFYGTTPLTWPQSSMYLQQTLGSRLAMVLLSHQYIKQSEKIQMKSRTLTMTIFNPLLGSNNEICL